MCVRVRVCVSVCVLCVCVCVGGGRYHLNACASYMHLRVWVCRDYFSKNRDTCDKNVTKIKIKTQSTIKLTWITVMQVDLEGRQVLNTRKYLKRDNVPISLSWSCQLMKPACLSSTVYGTTEYSHFTVKFLSTHETSMFVIHSIWDYRVFSLHC
jgi:hypothetical protein